MTDNTPAELSIADRKRLARDKIFGTKPESVILDVFGTQIEIKQMPLRGVIEYQQSEDRVRAAAEMIMRYAFVPGTAIPMFDETDLDSILALPFGDDIQKIQKAINKMTGMEEMIEEQLKNLTKA
jgi:hypothetical protein